MTFTRKEVMVMSDLMPFIAIASFVLFMLGFAILILVAYCAQQDETRQHGIPSNVHHLDAHRRRRCHRRRRTHH